MYLLRKRKKKTCKMTFTDHCESLFTLILMESFLGVNQCSLDCLKNFAFSFLFQSFLKMFGICFCYSGDLVILCSYRLIQSYLFS